MSRAYRIRVQESLSRHLAAEDGVCSSLELLPILPQERMGELLGAELAALGFHRDGAVATRGSGGTSVEIQLHTGEVSVRAVAQAQVELQAERSAIVNRGENEPRETQLRQGAQAALERQAEGRRDALEQQVRQAVEQTLRALKEELDGVVNRVTVAALKERAAQLGQIESIQEEAGGNLTIKIKV